MLVHAQRYAEIVGKKYETVYTYAAKGKFKTIKIMHGSVYIDDAEPWPGKK